jgi:hypothetical protein
MIVGYLLKEHEKYQINYVRKFQLKLNRNFIIIISTGNESNLVDGHLIHDVQAIFMEVYFRYALQCVRVYIRSPFNINFVRIDYFIMSFWLFAANQEVNNTGNANKPFVACYRSHRIISVSRPSGCHNCERGDK